MAGLDPAIHALLGKRKGVDADRGDQSAKSRRAGAGASRRGKVGVVGGGMITRTTKGLRVGRRKKQDLYVLLRNVLDARDGYLVWDRNKNPLPSSLGNRRKMIETFQFASNMSVYYFAELFWTYTDVIGCYRMARKYPWNPKYMARSEHLRFTSILFLQFVYIFEERMKGAVKWCNPVLALTQTQIDSAKFLKQIKKDLGPRIRARGQHVHEGWPPDEHIVYYQALEVMQEVGSFADGFSVKQHGLQVTRKHLCDQIGSELLKMENIMQDFYEQHGPSLGSGLTT
jgi:hypothetical protein